MIKNYQLSPTLKPETKLWRYMSLDKLIDILSSEELYFSPLSSYSKTDPYEGLLPKVILNTLSEVIKRPYDELQMKIKSILDFVDQKKTQGFALSETEKTNIEMLNKMMEEQLPQIERIYFIVMSSVAVNCWHQSDFESEGMWRLYSDSNKGIAIQTTVQSLIESISTEHHIAINEVNYIDYFNANLTVADCIKNGRTIPYIKRSSFAHEKEVRLSITPQFDYGDILNHKPTGIRVKTSPSTLIEKLYISPYASQPYPNAVSALIKKYKIGEEKIVNSKLLTIDDSLLKFF